MGMFDIVRVPCPKCGKLVDFQTKGGPCILKDYYHDRVPLDVASDVDRHNTPCSGCGTMLRAEAEVRYTSVVAKEVKVFDDIAKANETAYAEFRALFNDESLEFSEEDE